MHKHNKIKDPDYFTIYVILFCLMTVLTVGVIVSDGMRRRIARVRANP